MSLHFAPLERLSALETLGGIYPDLLEAQGLALDRVQTDVNLLDLNLVPDSIEDESILSRWESVFALTPNPGDSIAIRRSRILARIVATGGLSKPYFENLALALGYNVKILDPKKPFRLGTSRIGDALIDPLLTFRALTSGGSLVGSCFTSSDRSDRELHFAHNDRGQNLRLYDEGAEPIVWTWGIQFFDDTRESADILIETFLELKPAFTFLKWEILGAYDNLIDEGGGIVGIILNSIDEGSGGNVSILDSIDEGSGNI